MLDELLISHHGELYALVPIAASQCWSWGTLESPQGSYTGTWWQMDAQDDECIRHRLCWYEENTEENEDGSISVDYYKPDVILILDD